MPWQTWCCLCRWGCPAPIGARVMSWPFSAVSEGDTDVGGGRRISPLLLGSSMAGVNLATAQGNFTAVEGRLVEKDFEFRVAAPRRPKIVI